MKKNISMIRKVGGFGLAGVMAFGASGVMAETFNGTAAVQSALVVTNVADLDLGTLFATEASSGEYSYITFDATGATSASEAAPGAGFQVLQLGTVTPAQATVGVGSQTQFEITLPDAEVTDITATNAALAMASGAPVFLCAGGACGNAVIPRLALVDFVVGEVTGGTLDGQADNVAQVTPSFGSTEVGFNIGVTVVTDTNTGGGTARTAWQYEDTTYTGSFEVTASY